MLSVKFKLVTNGRSPGDGVRLKGSGAVILRFLPPPAFLAVFVADAASAADAAGTCSNTREDAAGRTAVEGAVPADATGTGAGTGRAEAQR